MGGRAVYYLRLSVTGRCNLRCLYCRSGDEESPQAPAEMPAEDLLKIVRAAALMGFRKVRLTGGEPLLRPDIVDLVRAVAGVPGIDDLALTTNGVRLARLAPALARAGLKRVNVSLDTLRPERFRAITGADRWPQVWEGIEEALGLGLHPVKLNAVVLRGLNDDEVGDLARLTLDRPLHLRFIEVMDFEGNGPAAARRVDTGEVRSLLEAEFGPLEPGKPGAGCGPARYWKLPGARGTVGFISPYSAPFCDRCNRMRVTAAGALRPCLHDPWELDLSLPLARGATERDLVGLFERALARKATHRPGSLTGGGCRMVELGG
ncbi:MAG: GTP 3',8-cyclase MoaA [Firmicutes bacterium]|nr:GTP 3',8-cyclase MoaA [Bacillota bacterium]